MPSLLLFLLLIDAAAIAARHADFRFLSFHAPAACRAAFHAFAAAAAAIDISLSRLLAADTTPHFARYFRYCRCRHWLMIRYIIARFFFFITPLRVFIISFTYASRRRSAIRFKASSSYSQPPLRVFAFASSVFYFLRCRRFAHFSFSHLRLAFFERRSSRHAARIFRLPSSFSPPDISKLCRYGCFSDMSFQL